MHQIIIDEIPCSICGAPKGKPCITEDEHGIRLDDFRNCGSLNSRLLVHIDTLRSIYENHPKLYDECTETSISLSDIELQAWNIGSDEALDMLFTAVDDWCDTSRFDLVDELLFSFVIEKMTTTMLVGILSITKSAAIHLSKRESFALSARIYLESVEPSRVNRLLQGLD